MLALVLCLFPLLINGAIPERAFYETNKGENLIYGDIGKFGFIVQLG